MRLPRQARLIGHPKGDPVPRLDAVARPCRLAAGQEPRVRAGQALEPPALGLTLAAGAVIRVEAGGLLVLS